MRAGTRRIEDQGIEGAKLVRSQRLTIEIAAHPAYPAAKPCCAGRGVQGLDHCRITLDRQDLPILRGKRQADRPAASKQIGDPAFVLKRSTDGIDDRAFGSGCCLQKGA